MSTENTAAIVPPYSSFVTLLNLIDRMEKEGVPRRVDKSYLVGMAGGTQNQVMASLRALGLTDDENNAQRTLVLLATEPDHRKEIMGHILSARFPALLEVATSNSTPGQLNEVLAASGLSGATTRKAATFFVTAATYAGFEVSPHLRPVRPGGSSTGTGTSSRRPKQRRRVAPDDRTPTPSSPIATSDMKRTYFDLLIDKAKASNDLDGDLLNRIERLIGVSEEDAYPKD
jgi:Family of unknown function (DUF5343)